MIPIIYSFPNGTTWCHNLAPSFLPLFLLFLLPNSASRCGENGLTNRAAVEAEDRPNTMRGKWCLRRWAAMPLLHMLLIFRASDAKLCGEFQVLGVFDDSDLESIRAFRDSLGNFSRLARAGATQACAGTVSRRELLLNDQMAAITVVNTTAEVFSGGKICFVVYSSFSSNGLFALDYALGREIPVVSTIPKKVITVLSAVSKTREGHSRNCYRVSLVGCTFFFSMWDV